MADDPRDILVTTVKAVYAAFERGDIEAALAYVAPRCELRPEGTSAATGRSVYRGHDGVRDYFADVARVWSGGLTLEPLDYRAVAGSVVVFGRVHGDGELGPIDREVVWVWKLDQGLLVSGQVFATSQAAIAAAHATV
jgi:ketosteroid isomerase-like protein